MMREIVSRHSPSVLGLKGAPLLLSSFPFSDPRIALLSLASSHLILCCTRSISQALLAVCLKTDTLLY
ncbi:hypothetical protein F511_24802 [Dorcoceras hygrometricum]|uniref:Uncharacterized protein n=1 Tax=Dorcoceras hygrometricum TaxID=472368 RepID=A0A2Z7BD64_9LAMI|nr:hypothetical protein F511_24802 [Dorcoceras hygrometricum]